MTNILKTGTVSLITLFLITPRIEPYDVFKSTIDYVPNKETAIKIAEAIWLPLYGNNINRSRPFVATLIKDSIWEVEGTLPKGYIGGVPYIEIQKSDCKILYVTHGK